MCVCVDACMCVCVRACVRALFLPSLHSLLEERVHSSLADDEVCPLHYHNACKEPSVTGVFQPLALIVALQITFKYMHKQSINHISLKKGSPKSYLLVTS